MVDQRGKKMNVYLASSFSNIEKVKRVCAVLQMDGHVITEKWWCRPYQVEGLGEIDTQELKKVFEDLDPEDFYNKPETMESFIKDCEGVTKADALIVVASNEPRKYNGATFELGFAVGQGMPVAVIGQLETSVMFSPVERLVSYQQVREWVNNLE